MHTILLVDDDEADAYLFKRAVEDVAAQTGVCVNITHMTHGREGCEALKRGGICDDLPDTIVVDLNMPVMKRGRVRSVVAQPTRVEKSAYGGVDDKYGIDNSRHGARRGSRSRLCQTQQSSRDDYAR
jgi:hypothetical protein